MTIENAVRVFAGGMILVSLALALNFNINWLYLTGFVGVNLIQSAFTGFCLAAIIFKKIGLKSGGAC